MAGEIRVPTLGESIVEATVGKWLKQVGDHVEAGEPLVELETDKVNVEVMAEESGVLGRIDKEEGSDVAIGDVLGAVETNGAGASAPVQQNAPASESQPVQPAAQVGASATTQTEQRTVEAGQGSDGHDQEVAASPVARRMAAANNVDLAGVQGSGPGGRVVKGDVAAQLHQGEQQAAPAPVPAAEIAPALKPAPAPAPTPRPQPAPAPQPASVPQAAQPDRREERIRMTRRRQTIARRLVEAQHNAAMLTTFNEIDMSAIMALRKRRGEAFLKRYDVKLGFMSFFTKAAVGALKAFPMLNAEIQGDEFVVKHYYDIGIAVGVEEGLVVPVVRDADRKSFAQLEREIGELAKRAREGTLGLNDLQGGTFTITNGGVYGSLMSTPILNAPQVGILGMHKTQERPVVVNGEIVVRPMMYVALSYDHRIVDGSEAVRFLVRVKELAEDPESLLLEG
ncbi:MAG TPA: 2-oxoglutarate dehydrogenase complex dihydrolipoyllysine-residue succinyltransferase [Roseiflexaceae bacterium]|jgi:2-oxoglutarate dehydrogenase E2 component (dihydrolipoamide succinyltransferase)|nr:2-oxoglutarate dehydrogenase complex dihydrolipoyllysine-residue succinyltransferase [Roseiflexaceae bacterium]